MSNHLAEKVMPILTLSNSERINYIKQNKWIGHDAAKIIIMKMEDLLLHPDTHRKPNILIKSATNNGKSSILKRFNALHPPIDDPFKDRIFVPVLNMEIPSAPKPDDIYSCILRELRLPFRESYSKELKFQMVKDGLKNFEVKMLCFDEFHVMANTTKLIKMQLLDTIKYLSNQAKIPIVGAGTVEAHVLLLSDEQLANRFEPYVLPQWSLNDEFRGLLSSFEALIPLKYPSNLQDPETTTRIFAETEGWIGEVHAYLTKAAAYAIENNIECITAKVLNNLDWVGPTQRRIVS